MPPGDVQGARWQHLPARGLKRRRKEGAKHESPSEPQPPPAAEGASPGPAAAAAAVVPARGHPSYGTTSGGLPSPAARPAPSLGASARQRPLLNLCRSRGPAAAEHPPPARFCPSSRSGAPRRPPAPLPFRSLRGREGGVFPKCKEKSVGFPSSPLRARSHAPSGMMLKMLPFKLLLVAVALCFFEGDAKFGESGARRRRCLNGTPPRRLKKRDRRLLSPEAPGGAEAMCRGLYPRLSCCSRADAQGLLHAGAKVGTAGSGRRGRFCCAGTRDGGSPPPELLRRRGNARRPRGTGARRVRRGSVPRASRGSAGGPPPGPVRRDRAARR